MTTQYWVTGASGDWSDAADWQSGAVPGSTDGAVITGSYGVTVDGTAAAYSLTLDESYLTVSGTLTLGTSLTVDDSATLTLSGGTLSAQSISSNDGGYLSGYGTISGAVSGLVFITAAGGALQVQGSLAGDQGRFTIDGGSTLELTNGDAAPVIFDGNSATLKLDAPAAFTGPIEQIVVGDAIDLAGITASSATYSGSTLTINETDGQQLVYNNVTGSLAGAAVTTASDNEGGTLVYWGSAPAATSQYWVTGASGDWSDAADWQSGAVPGSTDGAVITGSYGVTVDGTAAAYSLTLDESYLTVSGTLTLGTSLTVDDSATLTLSGGTLSAQSISSNDGGYLSGYGTISGAVSGLVFITAAGGALQVQGSLAGDQGRFTIDGGSTLELTNGDAAPVIFDGNSATLKLDAPAAFTGPIEQIVVGDAIDLAGITASSATYSGSTLTINETDGQQLVYNNVTGSLAGAAVTTASDNEGGTLVYWGSAPAATSQYWVTGASGDWSDAADWQSGAVPGSTDGAVITGSYGVTVDGTAAAYSLTLDESYLTVSGTLTLGTSLTVDDSATLTLSGGTLSAQSISSNDGGYLSGYGTISGAVSGLVFITAAGGALQVQGSLAGDQGRFTIDGGSTLELTNGDAAPVIFDGNSATLKLDAPAAFTGPIEQIVVGDAIDLAGITASSATYSGSTLTINETDGQQLTYNNVTGSLAGAAVTTASDNEGGTLVYWSTAPATSQYWVTGASGDWSDAADWQSGAVPGSTDGAVITGSYGVTVDGTAAAYSLTLDESYLTVSGTLTLGTSLTVDDSATLTLSGGTLSAQSISSNDGGYLSGYGTISGAVSGLVFITAAGGALQVQGSLAGDQGRFTIDGGSTLELTNGDAAPVIFDGNSATLKLDAPAAFTGPIEQIVVGDAIDLAGITASSATYSGSTLTINETDGQQLVYNNVTGSLAGAAVTTASDNEGGTLVYWGSAPAATSQYWVTGASGDWSDAADWQSGAVPGSTDGAVITGSYGVTVDGTAAAYSLTLDESYLTVSGTLTLGTSLTVDDSATLTLSGGTLSAQSISSNDGGYLSGYGTISGAVSGLVFITAAGGALQVQGSLAGDQGRFTIDGGSTLELTNGDAAPVIFDGNSATLKLDAPAAFTGPIEQIVVGDAIDLAGITASSATYSGSTLTINETDGQQLTYSNVTGSLTGAAVTTASDNNGGTLVYWSAAPVYPPPTAEPDRAHVPVAGTVTVTAANGVLGNDTDPIPDDTLTVSTVDGQASDVGQALLGTYGTLTLDADGGYSYAADHSVASNIIAQDIFTYTATDEAGGSATSTLTITITQPGQTYIAGTAGQPLTSGNGSVLLDGSVLQNETISAGNGNDGVIAGSNDTITLGNGIDLVKAGDNERITLGNGADTVTAGANSTITAGNGVDNVTAGSDSTITLGNGADTVTAGANSIITAGNGADNVTAGSDSTTTLSNGADTVTAGTNSIITAGNGADNVTAGSDSTIKLGNGADTVTAGANSVIILGNGADNVSAGSASTIKLGNGADTVTAGANSIITAGNGADNVSAGSDSTITLGSGSDTVTAISSLINGGSGQDSFVFTGSFGQETITNFGPQHDNIVLAHAMFANFGAVQSDMTQVGANTVIMYDPANVITLTGIKTSSLLASDFHFV